MVTVWSSCQVGRPDLDGTLQPLLSGSSALMVMVVKLSPLVLLYRWTCMVSRNNLITPANMSLIPPYTGSGFLKNYGVENQSDE
jgi:hypothetical protein